jgi:hypothetical protein
MLQLRILGDIPAGTPAELIFGSRATTTAFGKYWQKNWGCVNALRKAPLLLIDVDRICDRLKSTCEAQLQGVCVIYILIMTSLVFRHSAVGICNSYRCACVIVSQTT